MLLVLISQLALGFSGSRWHCGMEQWHCCCVWGKRRTDWRNRWTFTRTFCWPQWWSEFRRSTTEKTHDHWIYRESRHCDLSWLSEDSIYYTRLHYKHMMCFTHRTTFIRAWQAKHWMYQTECKDTHLMFPKTSFTGSAAVNAVWMLNPKKTMKESSF